MLATVDSARYNAPRLRRVELTPIRRIFGVTVKANPLAPLSTTEPLALNPLRKHPTSVNPSATRAIPTVPQQSKQSNTNSTKRQKHASS